MGVLAVGAGWAAVAGGLRSFTVPALVFVLVPILVLGWLAVSGRVARPDRRPDPLPRGWVWWLVPAVTFGVLELLSLVVWHSSHDHPSVSLLLDGPLEVYPVRAVAVFGWLAAGWALVRR